MSNWIDPDLFKSFLQEEEKQQEQQQQQQFTGQNRREIVYPTFERGKDANTNIEYVGRLLPNINTTEPQYAFKVRFFYHFFKNSDGKWVFTLCPKTWNMDNYCSFCSASMKLWNGTPNDKKQAPKYNKKEKYAANYYAIEDPRDIQLVKEGKEKLTDKVWILEFPGKLNSKIVEEQKPGKQSRGINIYNPGDEGYDMIVKVKSTKPSGDDKKVFHCYDDSTFALKQSAIADDKRIKEIMESRHDIVAYIKGMEPSIPDIVSILKDELIWELVKDEFKKKNKLEELALQDDTPVDTPNEDTPPWEDDTPSTPDEPDSTNSKQEEGEVDLETLLAEAGIDIKS